MTRKTDTAADLSIDEVIQHYLEKNLEMALYDNNVQNKVAASLWMSRPEAYWPWRPNRILTPTNPFTIVDPEEAAAVEALTGDQRSALRSEVLNRQWRNKAHFRRL